MILDRPYKKDETKKNCSPEMVYWVYKTRQSMNKAILVNGSKDFQFLGF